MENVILLTPLTGNGGIASWSRKYIKTFKQDKYKLIPIDRSVNGRSSNDNRLWSRFKAGLEELFVIRKKVLIEIKHQHISILHTTTSGSLGTFRDYMIARICKKYQIKTIMHCRYGCITEDVSNGLMGAFLRHTMRLFSQIWVLDSRSLNTLKQIRGLEDKVFLTPNSISAKPDIAISPKSYKHVAFIANLIPSKGLYELINAVVNLNRDDLKLSIVGTGSEDVITKAKKLAGDKLDKNIYLLGQLPNDQAVEFMNTIDILALPTYMPYEAFPISILEAMSLGKLVISTHRAAIGDMLTGLDGKPCGCFVREHSVEDIEKALNWCKKNPTAADELCHKAYNKVYNCYRMEIVYNLYTSLYDKLLKK